jgi:hypothetical protein
MLGITGRTFAPLCNRSLESLVPADHFYRHLDAKLDLGFVRHLVRDMYREGGRPSIDPVVFFKLQLVMCFEGIRSERELVRVAADRLSVRWYLGYDLHESLPDHSSLTRIRSACCASGVGDDAPGQAEPRPHPSAQSLASFERGTLAVSENTAADTERSSRGFSTGWAVAGR